MLQNPVTDTITFVAILSALYFTHMSGKVIYFCLRDNLGISALLPMCGTLLCASIMAVLTVLLLGDLPFMASMLLAAITGTALDSIERADDFARGKYTSKVNSTVTKALLDDNPQSSDDR